MRTDSFKGKDFITLLDWSREEVETILTAFDAVMEQATHIRGRVWSQSAQLVKHARSQ